jgi:hypothetical protein
MKELKKTYINQVLNYYETDSVFDANNVLYGKFFHPKVKRIFKDDLLKEHKNQEEVFSKVFELRESVMENYYVNQKKSNVFDYTIVPRKIYQKVLSDMEYLRYKVNIIKDPTPEERHYYSVVTMNIDKIFHFLNHLYFNTKFESRVTTMRQQGYTPIAVVYLQENYNQYLHILDYLEKYAKIIDIAAPVTYVDYKNYRFKSELPVEKRCKHARIHSEFRIENDFLYIHKITMYGFLRKFFNSYAIKKKEQQELVKDVERILGDFAIFKEDLTKVLKDAKIPKPRKENISNFVNRHTKLDSNSNVLHFDANTLKYSRENNVNRAYSTFNSMPKELRGIMKSVVNNKLNKTVELDFKNSHFYILSLLFDKKFISRPEVHKILGNDKQLLESVINNSDKGTIDLYHKITAKGIFYDVIKKYMEDTVDLTTVKFSCIYTLFESREKLVDKRYYNIINKTFPFICAFKNILGKFHDKKRLSTILMQVEAYLNIDRIFNSLKENGYNVITVHDSFLVQEKDSNKIKKLIKNNLSEILSPGQLLPSINNSDASILDKSIDTLNRNMFYVKYLKSLNLRNVEAVLKENKSKFYRVTNHLKPKLDDTLSLIKNKVGDSLFDKIKNQIINHYSSIVSYLNFAKTQETQQILETAYEHLIGLRYSDEFFSMIEYINPRKVLEFLEGDDYKREQIVKQAFFIKIKK